LFDDEMTPKLFRECVFLFCGTCGFVMSSGKRPSGPDLKLRLRLLDHVAGLSGVGPAANLGFKNRRRIG